MPVLRDAGIGRIHRRAAGLPGRRPFGSPFTICHSPRPQHGFTLIELMVVMVIVALLLSLAVPHYFHSVDRARESVLRQDLAVMRDALDKHFADTGRYPKTLEELVQRKYLRGIPRDPVTDSPATWTLVPPADAAQGGIYDIRSGAEGTASDGSAYRNW